MNKVFKFYNSYIWLELKEKERLAGLEMLENFAEIIAEKDHLNHLKDLEISGFQHMLSEYQKSEVVKDQMIENQKERIESLEKDLASERRAHAKR